MGGVGGWFSSSLAAVGNRFSLESIFLLEPPRLWRFGGKAYLLIFQFVEIRVGRIARCLQFEDEKKKALKKKKKKT
jgi:hypothetical protein